MTQIKPRAKVTEQTGSSLFNRENTMNDRLMHQVHSGQNQLVKTFTSVAYGEASERLQASLRQARAGADHLQDALTDRASVVGGSGQVRAARPVAGLHESDGQPGIFVIVRRSTSSIDLVDTA